jgi:transposase InsO family protein
MRHALGSLAAAALAAGILASPAAPAYANGAVQTFENHPDVRMFTPTPLIHDSDATEPAAPAPVKVVVHVLLDALALDRTYREALAWEYRKDRIHRALGHRYTGFIKMYRGPRYPF